jgi:hypothetical protein
VTTTPLCSLSSLHQALPPFFLSFWHSCFHLVVSLGLLSILTSLSCICPCLSHLPLSLASPSSLSLYLSPSLSPSVYLFTSLPLSLPLSLSSHLSLALTLSLFNPLSLCSALPSLLDMWEERQALGCCSDLTFHFLICSLSLLCSIDSPPPSDSQQASDGKRH